MATIIFHLQIFCAMFFETGQGYIFQCIYVYVKSREIKYFKRFAIDGLHPCKACSTADFLSTIGRYFVTRVPVVAYYIDFPS